MPAFRAIPTRIPVDFAVDEIATGEDTTCVRGGDRIACMGDNKFGEVFDGLAPLVGTPTIVELGAAVVRLELAQASSAAITADRGVVRWGGNGCGQAGGAAGPLPSRVPGIAGVTDLATSDTFSCAVVGGGDIWCWGVLGDPAPENNACAATPKAPMLALAPRAPVVDLDGGCHDHACAVLADGSVWCLGTNSFGQLGSGDTTSATAFRQVVGMDDAIDIGVGAFHTCAVRRDGRVACWGTQRDGALGDDVLAPSLSEVPVDTVPIDGRVETIEAGCSHTCAYGEGRMWCWGGNSALQLGNGEPGAKASPVEVWSGDWREP